MMLEIVVEKLIALLYCIGLLMIARVGRKCVGNWYSPASILSLFWAFYIALPVFVGWGIPLNSVSIGYIFWFIALFALSVFAFSWKLSINRRALKPMAVAIFGGRSLFVIFLLTSIASISAFIVDMSTQGFALSLDIVKIGGEYASKRYASELAESAAAQFGTLLSFPTAVLGGLVLGTMRSRLKKVTIIFFAFSPALFIMIFQSAKGLFILSIALFIGGWFATKLLTGKTSPPNWKNISYIALFFIFGLALISLSFFSRGIGDSTDPTHIIKMLSMYFASYSSGHLFAFSEWFTDRYFEKSSIDFKQVTLTGGFYTFMSIFKALGDGRIISAGIYDEVFSYDDFVVTNIFTIFRGLISDFGLIGSLFIAYPLGLICHYMFHRLLSRKFDTIAIVFFSYFFAFSYQTFTISTLTWLSIPVSFCLTVFLLWVARKKYNNVH